MQMQPSGDPGRASTNNHNHAVHTMSVNTSLVEVWKDRWESDSC